MLKEQLDIKSEYRRFLYRRGYLITNRSNKSACKCYENAGGINNADDEAIYVYDFRNKD